MTRSQTLIPSQSLAKDIMATLGGATLTALLTRVEVPMQPVPFTLQTLAVVLCGLSLGAKRGAASQVLYLAAGAAGMPIFSQFQAGPQVLVGPTGGYLLGFVAGAYVLGLFAERGWDRKPLKLSVAVAAGLGLVFAMGLGWLSLFVGPLGALQKGLLPFFPSEIIKAVAAVLSLPAAHWLTQRFTK